ncbi:MAG: DUF5615 family PIN-like protein [bacterium]|jgi:predicted nuclease of predicted toxin-antitoxin system
MRLLLDTCINKHIKPLLIQSGHDVVLAGDFEFDPGDEAILVQAHLENRTLVTPDNDFRALAVLFGRPHCGIIRLVDIRGLEQAVQIERILDK